MGCKRCNCNIESEIHVKASEELEEEVLAELEEDSEETSIGKLLDD